MGGDPLLPSNLGSDLRALAERVSQLERAPQMPRTSVQGGSVHFLDDAGNERVVIGQQSGGHYGLTVRNPAGIPQISVDERGLSGPYQIAPTFPVDGAVSVTSGSFVSIWRAFVELIDGDTIQARISWSTDAATTGEVRLYCSTLATATSAVALAASSGGLQEFKWLHGGTLGAGPYIFEMQYRRTGGAGAVNAWPSPAMFQPSVGAGTATGL